MSFKVNKKTNYILHNLAVGSIETNCYIFGSVESREVAIIDPGADHDRIKELLDGEKLTARFIINTHGHIDHIGANHKFKLPIYIHKEDADFLTDPSKSLAAFYPDSAMSPKASRLLEDGDEIKIAEISLKVLHTPGHTPGGISLYCNGLVFTGDALFAGGIGRTDFPYGDEEKLLVSIKSKLLELDENVIVLPGHGSSTTIGQERQNF